MFQCDNDDDDDDDDGVMGRLLTPIHLNDIIAEELFERIIIDKCGTLFQLIITSMRREKKRKVNKGNSRLLLKRNDQIQLDLMRNKRH